MFTTIWEPHFYRLNTGLPPMPAVHCRRANAMGGWQCGKRHRRGRERGEGQRGERHHGERQRREIDRLHRRWRDTASQLTKDGRVLANALFGDGKMAVLKAGLKGGRRPAPRA